MILYAGKLALFYVIQQSSASQSFLTLITVMIGKDIHEPETTALAEAILNYFANCIAVYHTNN